MTIIQNIKSKQLDARKHKDKISTSVLTALYSEVSIVGKNNGNRETNDQEAIAVIKKFIKGVNETVAIFEKNSKDTTELKVELSIYESFLPKQMSENELRTAIQAAIADLDTEISMKLMGSLMKMLNDEYSGLFDGNLASKIVKEELTIPNKNS